MNKVPVYLQKQCWGFLLKLYICINFDVYRDSLKFPKTNFYLHNRWGDRYEYHPPPKFDWLFYIEGFQIFIFSRIIFVHASASTDKNNLHNDLGPRNPSSITLPDQAEQDFKLGVHIVIF